MCLRDCGLIVLDMFVLDLLDLLRWLCVLVCFALVVAACLLVLMRVGGCCVLLCFVVCW